MRRVFSWKVFGLIGAGLLGVTTLAAVVVGVIFAINLSGSGCNPTSDASINVASGGGSGEWTKKGTKRYNTAKQVFEHLTKDLGLSGAAAAGVMGNMARESYGFDTAAKNPNDGGEGLIQWTFGRQQQLEARARKAGKPWTDLGVQIDQLESDLKNPAMLVSGKYSAQTLLSFGQLTNPEDAASHFYLSAMEAGQGWNHDPDGSEPERRANAVTAYKLFNGSSVSADTSKLAAASGKGGKVSGSSSNSNDDDTECDDDGAGGDWGWPFKSIKGKPQVSGGQLFGHTRSGTPDFHDGIDFGTVPYNNQDILAIHGGKVTKIGHEGYSQNDLGWYVWVKGNDGYNVIYQEFAFSEGDKDAISVEVGDTVHTGQKIGRLSSSYSNVTHVHIGATKQQDFGVAESRSFTDDGTWVDWSKFVK